MTSGQDVSEYLDTLGLVKSYVFKFFWAAALPDAIALGKKNKKIENFFLWCSADAPEDKTIFLFARLLANPDVPLSQMECFFVYKNARLTPMRD
jgi:hypothetical protein